MQLGVGTKEIINIKRKNFLNLKKITILKRPTQYEEKPKTHSHIDTISFQNDQEEKSYFKKASKEMIQGKRNRLALDFSKVA